MGKSSSSSTLLHNVVSLRSMRVWKNSTRSIKIKDSFHPSQTIRLMICRWCLDFRQTSLVSLWCHRSSTDGIAAQEPGTNEEIQQFCQVNFGVTFPVLAKIDVNGDNTDPVFRYIKKQK